MDIRIVDAKIAIGKKKTKLRDRLHKKDEETVTVSKSDFDQLLELVDRLRSQIG